MRMSGGHAEKAGRSTNKYRCALREEGGSIALTRQLVPVRAERPRLADEVRWRDSHRRPHRKLSTCRVQVEQAQAQKAENSRCELPQAKRHVALLCSR